MPIHAEGLHLDQPARVVGLAAGIDLQGVPQRVPVNLEPMGKRVHGRVAIGPRGRGIQHRSRRSHTLAAPPAGASP